MFTANMYVDVYRETQGDQNYSEYDLSEPSPKTLVYQRVPIHITPFRPRPTADSRITGQTTNIIANTRRNYLLKIGDILRSGSRTFTVKTVEPTGGAFYTNSIIYQLDEDVPLV